MTQEGAATLELGQEPEVGLPPSPPSGDLELKIHQLGLTILDGDSKRRKSFWGSMIPPLRLACPARAHEDCSSRPHLTHPKPQGRGWAGLHELHRSQTKAGLGFPDRGPGGY